jgi:hypothetical protein
MYVCMYVYHDGGYPSLCTHEGLNVCVYVGMYVCMCHDGGYPSIARDASMYANVCVCI